MLMGPVNYAFGIAIPSGWSAINMPYEHDRGLVPWERGADRFARIDRTTNGDTGSRFVDAGTIFTNAGRLF